MSKGYDHWAKVHIQGDRNPPLNPAKKKPRYTGWSKRLTKEEREDARPD